jgi:Uma2 family endonuclease
MSVASAPPSFLRHTAFRRYSVAEYHKMIRAGILGEEDNVELLQGYVVLKMARNPPHDSRLQFLHRLLISLLPPGWDIRGQSAITLNTSEPEPDLAVVRGTSLDYDSHHPGPSEIGLVIEIADSSLQLDRDDKGPIYAEAGLREYWIVNIPDRQIEVYTDPTGAGATAHYQTRRDYRPGDTLPFVLDGATVGQISIAAVFP